VISLNQSNHLLLRIMILRYDNSIYTN
jgi:hypothetical protein